MEDDIDWMKSVDGNIKKSKIVLNKKSKNKLIISFIFIGFLICFVFLNKKESIVSPIIDNVSIPYISENRISLLKERNNLLKKMEDKNTVKECFPRFLEVNKKLQKIKFEIVKGSEEEKEVNRLESNFKTIFMLMPPEAQFYFYRECNLVEE